MIKTLLVHLLTLVFLSSDLFAQIRLESFDWRGGVEGARSGEANPVIVVRMGQKVKLPVDARRMGDGYHAVLLSDFRMHLHEWDAQILEAGWLHPDSKQSPEWLLNPEFSDKWSKGGKLKAHVFYFGCGAGEMKERMLSKGIVVHQEYPQQGLMLVEVDAGKFKELLSWSNIMYMTPYSDERTPLANLAINMNRVNRVHPPSPKGLGLKGNGIGIGVWDFGAAGSHVDFENGLENVENQYFNNTGTQHTSLVTGAIIGRGVLRQDILGVAPDAKVYVHNFFGDIIGEMRAAYNNRGIRVTNHSYNVGGAFQCFVPYVYDAVSSLLDDYVREKPDMVNVYAAGNSATLCAYSFSTIVPGFQYAKNIITVGNLQNDETPYPGSARGPTTDGRLRPEVMAKGASTFTPTATGIVLTGLNQNYTAGFGTSFAAPQVAGIIGLMQEAANQLSNPMPSASLVKAILCNTAKDLGNPGPDYSHGFGMVDAYKAITSYQNGQYFEDSVTDGQQKTFNINIPSGIAQLKVALSWTDPATLLPAIKILTNDLDLMVVEGTDTTRPWKLNPLSPSAIATRGRDSLNNIEQVTISNPSPGTYTILVKGFDIPDGPQHFSISWFMEDSGAKVTYPSGGEVLAANVANFVRWDAFNTDSLVDVEYSLNGGVTWTTIGTVPASRGYIPWTTPNVYSDSALVRLRNGATTWAVSDSFFAIMARPTTASLLQCNYGLRVGWTTVTGATAYVISSYENGMWKDLDTATVSPYYITNAQNGKEYILAVRPISAKVDGPRSIATRLVPRPVNCSFPVTDIGMVALRPLSGRQSTSTSLGSSMPLRFRIQNFRNAVANFSVTVSWQVNAGPVVDSTFTINIPANSFIWFTTANTYNFSAPGDYAVKAWLSAAADTRKKNDTIQAVIRQLPNPAMDLPFNEGFDSVLMTISDTTIGLPDLDRFDFYPFSTARVNTIGGQIFAPLGRRAITLDNYGDVASTVGANFRTLLNLTNYADSTVYFDFQYRSRGETNANDSLLIRGSDTSPWIRVFDLFSNAPPNAQVLQLRRINLSKILQDNGQAFSTSTEIRQMVNTNLTASFVNTNGGYTFDDYKLYSPGKDVELLDAQYANTLCLGASADTAFLPLRLVVRNNFVDSVKNISLTFSRSDTTYTLATIQLAKFQVDTISYTLPIPLDSTRKSSFSLWLFHSDDRLRENDSLLNLPIRAVDIIPSLPYLNDFEDASNPTLVTVDGDFASWQRGFPSKPLMYAPAEGNHAWVTGLSANYNILEKSAIYLGCFAPALLDSNGQIAFHHLFQTEIDYDWVTLEYSQNGGLDWLPLGRKNNGFNWFNQNVVPPGWEGQRTPWQVASYPLHADSFPSLDTAILRLKLNSDELEVREGFALDDLRLLAKSRAIILQDTAQCKVFSNGTGLLSFLDTANRVVAMLDDMGQSLDSVTLSMISLKGCTPTLNDRWILPRKFFFKSDNPLTQEVKLTVFVSNAEYLQLLDADTSVRSMREIGVMLYNGPNADDTLHNNAGFGYSFLHPDSVRFLPYSNGYEVSFKVPFQQCEIYLTGPNADTSIAYNLQFLDAIPNPQLDSTIGQIRVALTCSGSTVFRSCYNGTVTLKASTCGFKGTLTRPVINGVATFNDLKFARGPVSNIVITAMYAGGCSDTLSVNSNVFDVLDTIGSPLPFPQIILADQRICIGDSLLVDVSYDFVSPPAQYIWSPGATLNDSTLAQPTAGPAVNTFYQVEVMDNDGCSDTASFLLEVLDHPVVTLHPKDASGCYRTWNVEATGSGLTYAWQYNMGGVWSDIDSLDADFTGAKTSELTLVANAQDYDSVHFRAVIRSEGLCAVYSDSAIYLKNPVILLPDTGTYVGDIACDEGYWTYYSTAVQPGKFILAINWAPDSSLSSENASAKDAAIVTLRVDEDFHSRDSIISGVPHATYTMRRYWNVDIGSESLTEPVQMRFYYALQERQDIEDAAAQYITDHPGSTYEGFEWFKTISGAFDPLEDVQAINVKDAIALNELNITNDVEGGVLYALLDGISSFSGGTGAAGVGPLNSPLPVELRYFVGECLDGKVLLRWETASEFNADLFEVLRSADGLNFSGIARIPAAGYSNVPVTYSWVDSLPLAGNAYYRLAQRDFDGKRFLFNIIQTDCRASPLPDFRAFFVPERGVVARYVSDKDLSVDLEVYASDGRLLSRSAKGVGIGLNEWLLPSRNLLPGLCLIVLKVGDKSWSAKVMVH